MTDREQFSTKVEPIMDRVMQDLRSRQAEEVRRFMRSPAYILSGISGPDGGMASQAIALDSLKVTGEWNSKTVEDYVEMVKGELRKEGITVTPQLEEMMIDKMAREQVPQSSIDYILRKAGRLPSRRRSRSGRKRCTTRPKWKRESAGAWEPQRISRRWEASEAGWPAD